MKIKQPLTILLLCLSFSSAMYGKSNEHKLEKTYILKNNEPLNGSIIKNYKNKFISSLNNYLGSQKKYPSILTQEEIDSLRNRSWHQSTLIKTGDIKTSISINNKTKITFSIDKGWLKKKAKIEQSIITNNIDSQKEVVYSVTSFYQKLLTKYAKVIGLYNYMDYDPKNNNIVNYAVWQL